MRSFWKLTLVEAKLFVREPFAAFFTLAFPLMMLFIFGSIYGNEPIDFFDGRGSVDVSVPAYMAMIIGTVDLSSLTGPSRVPRYPSRVSGSCCVTSAPR